MPELLVVALHQALYYLRFCLSSLIRSSPLTYHYPQRKIDFAA